MTSRMVPQRSTTKAAWVGGLLLTLGLLPGVVAAERPAAAPPADTVREIYVPQDELPLLLDGNSQRVFLSRAEYEELAARASQVAEDEKLPKAQVLVAADYTMEVDRDVVWIRGTVQLELLRDDLTGLRFPLGGLRLRSAVLDDKPAAIGRAEDGMPVLFVRGRGKHELELELLSNVETTAAQQALSFQLPTPPATRWQLAVPGNVEVRHGVAVIRRTFDGAAGVTRFELVPQRTPTTIILSLNNRTQMQDRVVLARAVQIDELTQAYERLHATLSLTIAHGAVETFQFAVPSDLSILNVETPLMAKWAMQTADDGTRTLEIQLREPTTDTVVVQVVGERTPPRNGEWTFPNIRTRAVETQVSVTGLVADERLVAESLTPAGLIPIDVNVLQSALPASVVDMDPSRPRLRSVAAYYAPQLDFSLQGRFRPREARLEATSNLLVTLSDERLSLRAGFAILPRVDKLFAVELSLPMDWQVSEVTGPESARLNYHARAASDGTQRVRVAIPQGTPVGAYYPFFLTAVRTPPGWLSDWSEMSIEYPRALVAEAGQDRGAIAIQATDDLAVRPQQLSGLTPLDETEKAEFGWGDTPTSLAYRYDAQPYGATLIVQRISPRLTARTFSFLRVEPEGLQAHYELNYHAEQARARRLSFHLPDETPASVAIRGLNVAVKEYRSELVDGQRRWTADLADPQAGDLRLAVDFSQPLPSESPQGLALPLVRVDDVVYQSGTVAVEGSEEFDLRVTTAARAIDVGELVDAEYQVGKRLLGVFGVLGTPVPVTVDVIRRPEYGLPAAIVERAELVSLVSGEGKLQTSARYLLRSKAQFLEVGLPAGATLWTMTVDGQSAAPQREGDRLLLSLPPVGPAVLRDVTVVYESPATAWHFAGKLQATAPQLILRETSSTLQTVPTADLKWHLVLPSGHSLLSTGGTVFREPGSDRRDEPWWLVRTAAWLSTRAVPARSFRIDEATGAVATPAPATGLPPAVEDAMPAPQMGEMAPPKSVPADGSTPAPATEPSMQASQREPQAEPPQVPVPSGAPVQATPPQGAPEERRATQFWALEGVRSLPIELSLQGNVVTFASMGVDPQLSAVIARYRHFEFLAVALALGAALWGVALTRRALRQRIAYVLLLLFVSVGLPLVIGLLTGLDVGWVIHPLGFVGVALTGWYLLSSTAIGLASLAARMWRRTASRPAQAALALLLLWQAPGDACGQDAAQRSVPALPNTAGFASLVELLSPPAPVQLPAHAVIIPYSADDPDGVSKADRVLIPYGQYVKWWERVHGPSVSSPVRLPAAYGWSDVTYRATLDGAEFLTVVGRLKLDVLVEGRVSVILPLDGGVLTSLTVDGQPGRLVAGPPVSPPQPPRTNRPRAGETSAERADPAAQLELAGSGTRQIDLTVRYPVSRNGGWRAAHGQLPVAAGGSLDLVVPAAHTEVRLDASLPDVAIAAPNSRGTQTKPGPAAFATEWETSEADQTLRAALGAQGQFQLRWRPKIAERQFDPSLTATSQAVVDIQEDSVRAVWRVELDSRQGMRDTFTLTAPREFLIERVLGANVKGWKSTVDGDQQVVDVNLLRPSAGQEVLNVLLAQRVAVGEGAMAAFASPVLAVRDAAQHQGMLLLRRSPLLDVRVEVSEGLTRGDISAEVFREVLANTAEESPLGIRPFQAYRFAATPFHLRLSAAPYPAATSIDTQALLKVGERRVFYEAKLNVQVDHRPRYRLECVVPEDMQIEGVDGPAGMEWITVDEADGGQLLRIHFATGQRSTSLIVRGTTARQGATLAIPHLQVRNVDEQSGHVVVLADPAYDVRMESLAGCESVLLERVLGWLGADQRPLARVALFHPRPGFAATMQITPRTPRASVMTITNVRVTPFAMEDTVYLQWSIQDAGLREIQFQLPAFLRDARISVPLLRQKIIEDVADNPGWIRIRLELQDEVTDRLIVLVAHDRPLADGSQELPIPRVETGRMDQRFVVVESAGRDEVIVAAAEQVLELNRQQSEWGRLTAVLGDRITQAYAVRSEAPAPRLAIETRRRAAVQTAGARIGLAKTLLLVDAQGAYRGVQEYRVDNKTEQFLEVELPEGAELWTARVAGVAVQPGAVAAGANRPRARIPLIKTAPGDLDYAVGLKYGGQLRISGWGSATAFPFLRTVNIQVEQSQIELRLPPTFRWFGFGGNLGQPREQGDLMAGLLSYQSKQIEQLLGYMNSSSDDFSRMRASNNLKQLDTVLDNSGSMYPWYDNNEYLRRELSNTAELLRQARTYAEGGAVAEGLETAKQGDNRAMLGELTESQRVARSKNVVSQLPRNFRQDASAPSSASASNSAVREGAFNLDWIKGNQLQAKGQAPSASLGLPLSGLQDKKAESGPVGTDADEAGRKAIGDLGKQLAEEAKDLAAKEAPAAGDRLARPATQAGRGEQLERYRYRLESQQQPQSAGEDRFGGGGFAGGLIPAPDAAAIGNRLNLPSLSGALAGQAGQAGQVRNPEADSGLKSLDVDLAPRGTPYHFLTLRGDVSLTAHAVESVQLERLLGLGVLLSIAAATGAVFRRFR